jgi:hypothetical protein
MTFTFGARHVANVKKHMGKITANNTHRHDDICDTLYDGVKIGLIDKLLHKIDSKGSSADEAMNAAAQNMRRLQQLRMNRNGLR